MTDAHDNDGCARRYEQLRAQALDGGAAGFRLGLAMLERRGVAAWARAFRETAPVAQPQPDAGSVLTLPSASSELVDALAGMALARVAAG